VRFPDPAPGTRKIADDALAASLTQDGESLDGQPEQTAFAPARRSHSLQLIEVIGPSFRGCQQLGRGVVSLNATPARPNADCSVFVPF
jgi:hypothetical protein